jgi:hypothetical protein
MKKLVYLWTAVSLLLALLPVTVAAHTAGNPFVTDLIAGQHFDVGEVQVWNDGDYLYVKYVIDADLTPGDPSDDGVDTLIYKTHLHVAISSDGIPQKNGNPIPGQFEYSTVHDPGVDEYTYQIPLTWDRETELYIAAHAEVKKLGGLAGLEVALPDAVTMKVKYPTTGGPSYFPETTVSGGTNLDGVYEGWCIDTDHTIAQNTNYQANVYSSYESLPPGTVHFPENLDLVNWIINQGYVGQDVTTVFPDTACTGNITYGDIQRSIWELVEDNQSTSGINPWSPCRVAEILAAAQANGEGFEPGCGDVVAVILAPVNGQQVIIAQVTLIEVGVPCETIDETAWGEGLEFPGKNWAMYFEYTVQ